ncbi:hypothetical protein ACFQ3Z_20120 [Streptomyces nogalater]
MSFCVQRTVPFDGSSSWSSSCSSEPPTPQEATWISRSVPPA